MKEQPDGYPAYGSHLWPRTRSGRIAVIAFLALFALTQPPVVFVFANRTEPWIFGLPFLYAYLFVIYVMLIAVLLWARHKRL
jgi:hypothetical protein